MSECSRSDRHWVLPYTLACQECGWKHEPDPVVLAEMWERQLAYSRESRPCAEAGCEFEAVPADEPFLVGYDQDGNPVYLRKWRCLAGHWYHLEVGT